MILRTIKIILFLYLFFFFLSLPTILCGEQKSIQSSVNGRVSIQRSSATALNIDGEETDVGKKPFERFLIITNRGRRRRGTVP